MSSDLAAVVARLEKVAERLESVGMRAGGGGGGGDSALVADAAFLEPFADFMAGPVKKYIDLSAAIGGDVQAHAALVESVSCVL